MWVSCPMSRHQYPLLIIPELPHCNVLDNLHANVWDFTWDMHSYSESHRWRNLTMKNYQTVESPMKVIVVSIICLVVSSPPTDVRLTSIMNNSESASVTIEWDPPSQGGSPLNYTITTTPDLISGPPPVTTSTGTTITINYNTDYTITITASNRCVGNGDILSVNIGEFNTRFYWLYWSILIP